MEQAALESYYRHGKTFLQTGMILGGLKSETARRTINRALLKLRHPSKNRWFSVKAIIDRYDEVQKNSNEIINDLYDQIDQLSKGLPVKHQFQSFLDSRKADIIDLGLTTRVYNHLLDAGINTIEALLKPGSIDILMKRRHFGESSYREVINKMRKNGFDEWADRFNEKENKT